MTALTVQVVAANEDGFITYFDLGPGMGEATGYSNNAKVRIGRESSSEEKDYFGWVHLKNLTIAQGATINNAKLYLYWHASTNEETMGPNEEFSAGWYPSAGLEIKTVLQELVDRSGWSSGSNVNLKLTPSVYDDSIDWKIDWKDYDTSTSLAPKLVIDYTAAAASAATSPAFLLFSGM